MVCAPGTSRPKPLVNEVIIFGSTALGSKLNNMGGAWATAAVALLGVVTYEATTLCGSEPPAQPTITAAEYKALLEMGPPNVLGPAVAKLRDIITISAWYQFCECTSIATPPPPAGLLTPPAGVTVPDYNVTPCPSPQLRLTVRNGYNISGPLGNVTRDAFPNFEFTSSVAGDTDHPAQEIAQIPLNWISMHSFTQLISGSTPVGQAYVVTISFYDQNRVPTQTFVIGNASTQFPYGREPETGELAVPATARYFAINTGSNPQVTVPGTIDWSLTLNCSGSNIAQPGCCQDPVAISLLNGLVQELALVRGDVRLLQRYGLPFAYTVGTQHVGLVGTGATSLERSVGLQINVTAFPPGNQQMLGQPPYIFDLGWVSVLTPDGLLDEIRLTRQTTTWMSKLIPSSTRIGWGLRDGVVANITELRAEA